MIYIYSTMENQNLLRNDSLIIRESTDTDPVF